MDVFIPLSSGALPAASISRSPQGQRRGGPENPKFLRRRSFRRGTVCELQLTHFCTIWLEYRLKGRASPAKGYKFGGVFAPVWPMSPFSACEGADVHLRHFDLLKSGCANLGVFGAHGEGGGTVGHPGNLTKTKPDSLRDPQKQARNNGNFCKGTFYKWMASAC